MATSSSIGKMATSIGQKAISIGQIVMYAPKNKIFATSSGSITKNPVGYKRMCVVVAYAQNGQPRVAPLCGAKHISDDWGRRIGMEKDVWHPVHYVYGSTGKTVVPIPDDGYTIIQPQRQPIILTCNDHIPKPSVISDFKPCYMWVGDPGETLSGEYDLTDGYVTLNVQQLAYVEGWWKHWARTSEN